MIDCRLKFVLVCGVLETNMYMAYVSSVRVIALWHPNFARICVIDGIWGLVVGFGNRMVIAC